MAQFAKTQSKYIYFWLVFIIQFIKIFNILSLLSFLFLLKFGWCCFA